MKFHILTLFPGMFEGPFSESIIKRGIDKGIISLNFYNIRDYAIDKHKTVDDTPYGGGAGMVMKVEPLMAAIEDVKRLAPGARVIITSPRGVKFSQQMAVDFASEQELIVICGHYEGFDERVKELSGAEELSIGDYVMTGGELAAMVIIDSVARLQPGVLGSEESTISESFCNGLLEYPQYTRPPEFRESKVPEVLLSGNHKEIERWRRNQSLLKTLISRPELIDSALLDEEDKRYLESLKKEHVQ
ncbi:MAG: tRNA (guanosine(37)-N1)-methyltransferase TrmD [Desulfuromonadales bacterium]|nr:tRNA (guanosine(37)-N1)-methyltransferase TrmD [Desulfuromonadales bacterium]